MKSLRIIVVITLFAGACHSSRMDGPTAVSPQLSTNHLIPFSRDSLSAPDGIRLQAVHLNGRRYLEYIYKNGFLDQEINYSTDQRALYLGSSRYFRDAQGLRKIEYRSRTYDEGYPSADSTVLRSVLGISRPADTLINLSSPAFVTMSFDKSGTLIRQADTGVTSRYTLNGQLDVVLGTHIGADYQKIMTSTMYQYDNHPNPYRTTGRLTLSTDFSTFVTDYCPANIISYTASNPAQAYINTIRYEYNYRPDGYPTQVTVYDPRSEVYKPVLTFIYNK